MKDTNNNIFNIFNNNNKFIKLLFYIRYMIKKRSNIMLVHYT